MAFADEKQSFWPTILAFVTALATLLGAIGGIVATAAALTGGDGGSSSSPAQAPASATSTPSPVATSRPTASPATSPVASPTPRVIELTPEADSSWAFPSNPSSDEEHLDLDWGCSRDSRGNGSKQECGSGLIAVRFDLAELPKTAALQSATLALYADESGGAIDVYARPATTEWKDDEPPDCGPTGETAGRADGDQWTWEVTSLLQDERATGAKDFGLCLVLKRDAAIVFGSREGASSRAPALTITYR